MPNLFRHLRNKILKQVQDDRKPMNTDITKIKKYLRAANYLSVTQIYLRDNFLLDKPLEVKDLKQRLFGHWGTCPGINFVYAHLNYFVKKHKQSTMFVLGMDMDFQLCRRIYFWKELFQNITKMQHWMQKELGIYPKCFLGHMDFQVTVTQKHQV